MWSGSLSLLTGITVLQISITCLQRVWNLQPDGGFAGEGMLPSRIMRFILAAGSGTVVALSSAWG